MLNILNEQFMKKTVFFLGKFAALLAISVFIIAGLSSCEKNDKDPRDVFIGTYNAEYSYVYQGTRYFDDYTLIITKSSTNDSDILMTNISALNVTARATVNGNAIVIPQQTFVATGISGSGTLSGNILSFSTSETHTDYAGAINVSHTASKQ